MSWQKCPICNGSGIDPHGYHSMTTTPTCGVCNGKRILSEINGLPPGEIKSPTQVYDQQWIQPSDVKSYFNKEKIDNDYKYSDEHLLLAFSKGRYKDHDNHETFQKDFNELIDLIDNHIIPKEEELKAPSILSPIKTTFEGVEKDALLEELGITPEKKQPPVNLVYDFGNEKLINSHAQEIANNPDAPSITKTARLYDRLISLGPTIIDGTFTDLEPYLRKKINQYMPLNDKLEAPTTQNPTQNVSNLQSSGSSLQE